MDPSPLPVPPAPGDLVDFLYAHRINFAAGGVPLVTVRLMEGQAEVALSGEGPLRISLHGTDQEPLAFPAEAPLVVRVLQSKPAGLLHFVQAADLKFHDREGLTRARALWEGRGTGVTERVIGTIYGVAGRVLDNRRILLLLDSGGDAASTEAILTRLRARYPEPLSTFEELTDRPHGILQISDERGCRWRPPPKLWRWTSLQQRLLGAPF